MKLETQFHYSGTATYEEEITPSLVDELKEYAAGDERLEELIGDWTSSDIADSINKLGKQSPLYDAISRLFQDYVIDQDLDCGGRFDDGYMEVHLYGEDGDEI